MKTKIDMRKRLKNGKIINNLNKKVINKVKDGDII